MKKTFVGMGIGFAVLGLSAFGAEVRAEVPPVAGGANWAIHLDLAGFRGTPLGRTIEARERSAKEEKAIALAIQVLGFDLRTDLHAITLYGSDKNRRNAVVLARGDFDGERVRGFLNRRPSYSERLHGGHRILQWEEDERGAVLFREAGALAFHPSGTAVLAADAENVAGALDLLDGGAVGRAIPGIARSSGSYLVAFADLAALGDFRPEAALLRQSERFVLSVGEEANTFKIRATVEARDTEAARQMEAVVQGLQAYALLRSTGDWGSLPDWLLTATIVRDGAALHFDLDAPAGRVEKLLEKHLGR